MDLYQAVRGRDLDRIQQALPQSSQGDKNISLLWAVKNNLPEIVEILVLGGANVGFRNNEALQVASDNDFLTIVRYLLDHGGDVHTVYDYPLRIAVFHRNAAFAKLLITHYGANIHAGRDQPILVTVLNGDFKTFRVLLRYGWNIDAQALAPFIFDDDFDLRMLDFLRENGVNINALNNWLFIEAVGQGRLSMIRYLLNHGADVHTNNDEALEQAAYHNQPRAIELLLEYGANPDVITIPSILRGLIPPEISLSEYYRLEPLITLARDFETRWIISTKNKTFILRK